MCKPDSFKINAKIPAMILLLMSLGFMPNLSLRAQQTKGGPVTVSGVSSRPSAGGTLVSIAADGPLNRAQTWQDREGYHIVVPSAGTQNAIKAGKGIKVRQLDRTLEIVIQTKPGANVTVQPAGNRLNLNVEGKLDPGVSAQDQDTAVSASSKARQAEEGVTPGQSNANAKGAKAGKATAADQEIVPASSLTEPQQTSGVGSAALAGAPNVSEPIQGASPKQEVETASGELSVISGTTVLIVLGLGGLGLFFLRRRRSASGNVAVMEVEDGFDTFEDIEYSSDTIEPPNKTTNRTRGYQESLVKHSGVNGSKGASPQRKSQQRMTLGVPASLYGAYQVDQEIGRLVLGQAHKMDVVASRAPDDRRAIEASLLKTLVSADADDELRRRARSALEEYGFVARQSAALLMAADPYERTSAARMLGDVKSPAALPFLLEALYDHEALVRNQAVLSIGELRLPSAIGALLDIARKHPDVPGSLLSRALSACSLDGLDFFDNPIPEPRLLSGGVNAHVLANEITKLEPASSVQGLPENLEDEKLVQALIKIESPDIDERSEAIKSLGQFSTRTSVAALARVARLDPVSAVRALAISSLAFINHESVFPAILIAMADESRGVRAAAARSLSRLSFDRSDAYMRVTETDDAETLRDVAQACIKAGIAAQGIDRLASGDHQAYEALSVVSLLVKANAVEPLLEAIANHPSMDVRLTTTHILGLVGHPGLLDQLRQLAADSTSAEVKSALLETIAKLEAPQGVASEGTEFEFITQPKSGTEPETDGGSFPSAAFENEPRASFDAAPEPELGGTFDFDFDFEVSLENEDEAQPEGPASTL
jgi:HEAT repeat protein